MRILIVAFEFPPLNTAGARRPFDMAANLAASGHDVHVWTADYSGSTYEALIDEDCPKAAEGVLVTRISFQINERKMGLTSLLFADPDKAWYGWKTGFESEWKKLLSSGNLPDAIILTLPPFSLFRIARMVKKESRIPLLIDLRDHWSLWGMTPFATPSHYLICRNREAALLRNASTIITVTSGIRNDLLEQHRWLRDSQIHVCPNTTETLPADEVILDERKPKFRIGYFGAFYFFPRITRISQMPWYKRPVKYWALYSPRKELWEYRSPKVFFDVFCELRKNNPALADRVELFFAGNKPDWFDEMVADAGLVDHVIHAGRLSQSDARDAQRNCDLLLLTSARIPGGRDYCLARKTFDYISANRPILGCVSEGEQKDFLLQSGLAICISPDSPSAASHELENLLLSGRTFRANDHFLRQFTPPESRKTMETILRSISESSERSGSLKEQ